MADAPLRCERREILLPTLQGSDFFARGTLEIHPEPQNGNKDARYTSSNVLSRLEAFFAREFLHPAIVGLYLGHDRGAVGELILGRTTATGCGERPARSWMYA
jgi:hypothetical protein